MNTSLFCSSSNTTAHSSTPDDHFSLLPREIFPALLSEQDAQDYLAYVEQALSWKTYTIRMFGKTYKQPRLVAFYADPGKTYRYSQTVLEGKGRDPVLDRIRHAIQEKTGTTYNSVLCNLYRDGQDSMGWHSDDEKELGPDPIIASYTLGQERKFCLRTKKSSATQQQKKHSYLLKHNSLLLMKHGCQTHREHSLIKTTKQVGIRINLTFRTIYE